MNVLIVVCAQGILNAHSNEISAFEALGREANRLIANWRSIVCHRKKASVPSAKRPKHDGAPSAPNLLPLRKLECVADTPPPTSRPPRRYGLPRSISIHASSLISLLHRMCKRSTLMAWS